MQMKQKILASMLSVMLAGNAWAVEDALVKQADMLLKSGKAQDAYALLTPQLANRAGDPDFDYRLGVAALDSGHYNEAIFALERVLAVKPDHLQARAEIARAYLAVGERETSRQEFETVRAQRPPADVDATIRRFLDAIERIEAGERTTLRAYVEGTVGYDGNVNSATGSSQIAIPALGGGLATLSSTGTKQSDPYLSMAAGFNVRHAVTPVWALFGGGNFSHRLNATEDTFDTQSFDGNYGVSYNHGDDTYSAALNMQVFNVDNNSYRDSVGMTLQWQRRLLDSTQVSGYYQFSDLEYPGNTTRNADRHVLGAAVAHAMTGQYTPVVYVGVYAGEEVQRAPGSPHFGHRLFGARTGGELKLDPQTRLFGSVSLESRNYGGTDPLFLVQRADTQLDLKVGGSYNPAPSWTVTPQLGYTRNNSNVVLNDYNRTAFSVTVRRDFN